MSVSCGRPLTKHAEAEPFPDLSTNTNQLLPLQRLRPRVHGLVRQSRRRRSRQLALATRVPAFRARALAQAPPSYHQLKSGRGVGRPRGPGLTRNQPQGRTVRLKSDGKCMRNRTNPIRNTPIAPPKGRPTPIPLLENRTPLPAPFREPGRKSCFGATSPRWEPRTDDCRR
jgi:hypothetical protein